MITTDTPVIDLGILKYGIKKKIEYTITNTYLSNIYLDKIVLSCSACTTASIDKSVLLPTETATLTAYFTPGRLGPQTKTIMLYATLANECLPPLKLKFKSIVHE